MIPYHKSNLTRETFIQSKLFQACLEAGLTCEAEYPYEDCRFDLVAIEGSEIIAIVEVKKPDQFEEGKDNETAQIKKYKRFGVPVFILYSVYDIPYLVRKLISIQENFSTIFTDIIENDEKKKTQDLEISSCLDEFDKVFPNYKFTNEYSLEDLVTAVKFFGSVPVLERIRKFSEQGSDNFFLSLKYLLQRKREEELKKKWEETTRKCSKIIEKKREERLNSQALQKKTEFYRIQTGFDELKAEEA